MSENKAQIFDSALYALPERIALPLKKLPPEQKEKISEIRLRANQPLSITSQTKTLYLSHDSRLCDRVNQLAIMVFQKEIFEIVRVLTNNSIYSYTEALNQGFLPMRYGHRAGVTGNFSGKNLCEFSSLNIRIARQIMGIAEPFLKELLSGGVLLAGPPSSGKTTLLRDMARMLSSLGKRVAVIDTRGEISAFFGGIIYNDLGPNCDVLYGVEKARGIEIALRTLSPEFIFFDEIGTSEELKGVAECFNAGCSIVTTAHIDQNEQIEKRKIIKDLLRTGGIKNIILLDKAFRTKIEKGEGEKSDY